MIETHQHRPNKALHRTACGPATTRLKEGNSMAEENKSEKSDDSTLLKAVEAVAISPADAKHVVEQYRKQYDKNYSGLSEREIQEKVADKIIKRYAKISAVVGGTTALAGVVPGLGTAVAITGGATADIVANMKLQVDMCMCLAETFGYDINSEDARHLSFLIAAGATIQQSGVEGAVQIGSKAGVKLLKEYLKGPILVVVKEWFKKVGITFTRKALEKAIPFGVGVVIGGGANYGLVRYVGAQARDWFVIDRYGEA